MIGQQSWKIKCVCVCVCVCVCDPNKQIILKYQIQNQTKHS